MKIVANVLIRGVTLFVKVFFFILLAKMLEPEIVGFYGLFTSIIAYSILIIGSEFHSFSMREVINSNVKNRMMIVKNHFLFTLISYSILSPFLMIVFYKEILPWKFACMFYLLLALEYISQDLIRLLGALNLQLHASFAMFIRSGMWCIVLLPYIIIYKSDINIEYILIGWAISSAISIFYSIKLIATQHLKIEINFFTMNYVSFEWIIKGIKIAMPMFVVAATYQGFFTIDRIIVNTIVGKELLAAYILYMAMAAVTITIIDSSIVVFYNPKLVKLAQCENIKFFENEFQKYSYIVIILSLFLSMTCYIIGKEIVEWLNNPAYYNNFYIFKWLLLSSFLFTLSNIPHLALYALHEDIDLMKIQLVSFIIFMIVILLTMYNMDNLLAVPTALISAFATMIILKNKKYLEIMKSIKK